MSAGYPPTIILNTDRAKYYQTLDQAHAGNLEPFVNYIGRSVGRNLVRYLEAITPEKNKATEEKWLLLSELAPKTPYSRDYLFIFVNLWDSRTLRLRSVRPAHHRQGRQLAAWPAKSYTLKTSRKASLGRPTLPIRANFFLPFFCLFKSLSFRV